ncbi:hypothetical protein GCM10027195_21880 [Comamonas sediminis]
MPIGIVIRPAGGYAHKLGIGRPGLRLGTLGVLLRRRHLAILVTKFAGIVERVCNLYAAALECNRDEFEGQVRSLHRGASKGQRAEIGPFHSNP